MLLHIWLAKRFIPGAFAIAKPFISRLSLQPAARVTDLHVCPMVNGLVPHVGGPILPPCHVTTLIAGLPAARVTDKALCVGPPDTIVKGAATTFIGGLAAARIGSQTAHGGVVVLGCFTVWIGDASSGGAAGAGGGTASSSASTLQGMTMLKAKKSAKPFCEECAKRGADTSPPSSGGASSTSRKGAAQRQTLMAARTNGSMLCEECGESA